MLSFREKLQLYAITDRAGTNDIPLLTKVEQALKGGITCLQVREKNLPYDEFLAEAIALKKLCTKYNVPLIVNDNVDIAVKVHADGVHVGMSDTDVKEVRKLVGESMIIGATAKTVGQAITAQEKGADYLGVGAVFPTSTKPEAKRITIYELNKIVNSVSIPIVAIGGIDEENILKLKGSSISGIAVSSAIFSSCDTQNVCRRLLTKAKQVII